MYVQAIRFCNRTPVKMGMHMNLHDACHRHAQKEDAPGKCDVQGMLNCGSYLAKIMMQVKCSARYKSGTCSNAGPVLTGASQD